MSAAWQRFARRRLALTHWHCEPENIPAQQQDAFAAAWARQCRAELAVIESASEATLPAELISQVAASLESWLDEAHFSASEQHAIVQHHALLEQQFAHIAGYAPTPDDTEVLAWYREHQAQFMRPEQRLTSHLLLTVDNDGPQVQQQITVLYQQIMAARPRFGELAQRYSHCPSALSGGRLGWVSRGLLYPELETALFAQPADGVTPPVETFLGWHLLWCEEIRDPAPIPQEEALEKARQHLRRQHQQQWQRRWLAALVK